MNKKNNKTSHTQEVQQDTGTPGAQITLADYIDFLEKNKKYIDSSPFDFVDISSMITLPAEQEEDTSSEEQKEDAFAAAIEQMNTLLMSPSFKQAFADYLAVKIFAEHHQLPEFEQLAAELAHELRKIIDDTRSTKYSAYTVADLLTEGFNDDGTPKEDLFAAVLKKAKNRADRPTLPRIIASQEDITIYKPIDKVSSILFDELQQRQHDKNYIDGQIGIEDALTLFEESAPRGIRTGSTANIYVTLSATFSDDLPAELSKKLTFDDEEVHDVVATMIKEGIKITTLTHIYKRLYGKDHRPSARDLKAIDDSLTRLGSCRVTINNKKEIEAKMKYPAYYEVDDVLIHFRRVKERAIINGSIVEGYIEFVSDDIPIMMQFAESRKQITAVTTEQWNLPVRKSSLTQALKRYLFRAIVAVKSGSIKNELTYKTIYDNCTVGNSDSNRQKRLRIREYIPVMLDHWKKTKFIDGYLSKDDRIIINPNKQQLIEAKSQKKKSQEEK